jgi:hypothetical protein
MRFSRARRIGLLVPGLPWLTRLFTRAAGSDVSQYAAAGGGRLGPAAALLGVCLGGAGAAVCVTSGTLPVRPPLISHAAAHPRHAAAPRRHRAVHRTPAPTATAVTVRATPTATRAPRPTATPTATHRATPKPRRQRAQASRHEFGFENRAPAATPTPAPTAVTASAAGVGSTTSVHHAAPARPAAPNSEFGFEGG